MKQLKSSDLDTIRAGFPDWKIEIATEVRDGTEYGIDALNVTLDCGHAEVVQKGDMIYNAFVDYLANPMPQPAVH